MGTTFPTSLPKFQRVFPDDGACARYLEAIRWPDGFSCPKCGLIGEPYRFATRSSVVLRCRACNKEYVSHRRDSVAVEPHATPDLVLGRLSHGDTDARAVCNSIPAPA